MLGILQRYVLREIISPSLLGLLVFTFLLLVAHLFKMMDILINSNIRPANAVIIIACLLPTLLPVTAPMSLLMGVLLGFGRLASDSEVMAMRASGTHLFRITWPIIALSAIISGFMLWGNQRLAPMLALQAYDTELSIVFELATSLQPGIVHQEMGKSYQDMALYFRSRDIKTGELRDVTLSLGGSERRTKQQSLMATSVVISAPEGRIVPVIQDAKFLLELRRGAIHVSGVGEEGERSVGSFKSLRFTDTLDIGKRDDSGRFKKAAEMMTVKELRDGLKWSETNWIREKHVRGWRVDLARRHSVPLSCLAVVLLGIPLALRLRPSANALGFAIALALTFVYYVVLEWGVSLEMSGSRLGTPVIFLPNLLLGGIGVILMIHTFRR